MFMLSEWEIDTDVEACVGVQRYALLGNAEECVVHAGKEVEALRVEVDEPTESAAVGAGREVDTG